MPRLPRLQYPGAMYHILTRGDGRRRLFHDDRHYERFTKDCLTRSTGADGSSWPITGCPTTFMHLIKTPEPNLCRGMQQSLSGYANWYANRNRRTGHLYQGR